MALAKTHAISLLGLSGTPIDVEVDISAQLPAFVLIGLPDASLNEATSRVRAACSNSGFHFPSQKILVNLAPASVPKSGSSYDLAIAVAVIAAMGKISPQSAEGICFIGELALTGAVNSVRGVLPMLLAAKLAGFTKVVVPEANLAEAALVEDLQTFGCQTLGQAIGWLNQTEALSVQVENLNTQKAPSHALQTLNLNQVVGQSQAVHGLIVAAAGGHHLSMIGSPGSGKTMLAERLPTILPPLTHEQALELAAVESIVGSSHLQNGLDRTVRFQAPHHSATMPSLIGGGFGVPRPGAVSRAHHGVLFLDEAPEFQTNVLESLRETLESGKVTINRSAGTATFPAEFQLILAANPCPCGFYGSISRQCTCSALVRRRYGSKLSGPLRDRIDIRLDIQPVRAAYLSTLDPADLTSSEQALADVITARECAKERLKSFGYSKNAQIPGPLLKSKFNPGKKAMLQLDRQLALGKTSMRGFDRCIRVAWTIADLAGLTSPTAENVAQAVLLRGPDQMLGEF